MQFFAQNVYQSVLMKTLEYRWVTWAVATAVLIMALALVISGRVIFQFFPAVEGDRVYATLLMPEGINVELTEQGARQIENAVTLLKAEIAKTSIVQRVEALLGTSFLPLVPTQPRSSGPPNRTAGGSHLAEVVLELDPIETRPGWNSTRVATLARTDGPRDRRRRLTI